VPCDVDVEHLAPLETQYDEDEQKVEVDRRDDREVDGERLREVVPDERRPPLRGARWGFGMYFETVDSEMWIPSLASSPWIRGAPHPTFILAIWTMSLRTSLWTRGRPGPRGAGWSMAAFGTTRS
jgi:hypothetical protein